ncbi:MAG: DUF4179 domain-containing protein [Rubrobacteraceae bacterium]
MNRHERISKALRGYAEMRVPEMADPWPEIRDRTLAGKRSERPSSRRFRFVPRTRSGLVFAVLLVMLFSTGAYAGFPLVYDVFREALPGSAGRDFGTEIGQEQTDGGAKVTLEYAYADSKFVVVGYSVQDLKENRNLDGHPSELSPVQIDDRDRTPSEEKAELPPRVNLTDGSGQDFDMAEGSATYHADDAGDVKQPKPNVAIFSPSEGLKPGERHSFRLEVALEESGIFEPGDTSVPYDETPDIGPFSFDFEVPVRPVPVVEVNQKKTVEGITLTLERVLNSPGRPQGIVCFDSPNDDYLWRPSTAPTGFQVEEPLPVHDLEGDCWSLTLEDTVEGRSSVKVTEIWGPPRTEEAAKEDEDGKEIRGPWTFEFEAPEQ